MTIESIIKKYRSGKLDRELDEKYAEGFWDLAGEMTEYKDSEALQENA